MTTRLSPLRKRNSEFILKYRNIPVRKHVPCVTWWLHITSYFHFKSFDSYFLWIAQIVSQVSINHHSFLSRQDVLGGVLITAFLIALTYPAWTLIDSLDSASPLFPVCVIVIPFFLCYNYPVSDFYSPTRADTTTIVAAGAGVTLGFWINHFFQLVSQPSPSLPAIRNIPPLTTDMLVLGLTKFTVGIVLIVLVRQLVQNLSLQVLFSWFKVVTRNKEARRRLEIEVPYKFVTYTSVGICATTFVPMLHRFLGLLWASNRWERAHPLMWDMRKPSVGAISTPPV